jgi:hypothetical protein
VPGVDIRTVRRDLDDPADTADIDLAADRAVLLADGPYGWRELPKQLLNRVGMRRRRKVKIMSKPAQQCITYAPADQIELVSGLAE